MTRKELELDDSWYCGLSFDVEKQAQQEYSWLCTHNNIREYLLVTEPMLVDTDLDDDMPF